MSDRHGIHIQRIHIIFRSRNTPQNQHSFSSQTIFSQILVSVSFQSVVITFSWSFYFRE